MKIRTLIVDDEPLARDRVKRLLRDETDIAIIGGGLGTCAAALASRTAVNREVRSHVSAEAVGLHLESGCAREHQADVA